MAALNIQEDAGAADSSPAAMESPVIESPAGSNSSRYKLAQSIARWNAFSGFGLLNPD